jgi:hypothetical protein
MDELLMRLCGTLYVALLADASDRQRENANEMLLDMAERPGTPYACAEILRVIAASAAGQELHSDPPPSRPHLRVIAGGIA